jgi:hypothetical protein
VPMYDRVCTNDHQLLDCYEPIEFPGLACPTCGEPTQRVWLRKGAAVITDEIPGGVQIRHGLCNEDGTPRTYYSHSEIAAEAKRRGMMNYVEHVSPPGSDKSKHTTRWV